MSERRDVAAVEAGVAGGAPVEAAGERPRGTLVGPVRVEYTPEGKARIHVAARAGPVTVNVAGTADFADDYPGLVYKLAFRVRDVIDAAIYIAESLAVDVKVLREEAEADVELDKSVLKLLAAAAAEAWHGPDDIDIEVWSVEVKG